MYTIAGRGREKRYCEQSPNETSIYFQSNYYNYNLSSNQQSIQVNHKQMKQNGEQGGKARELDREQPINGEGEGALVKKRIGVGQNGHK